MKRLFLLICLLVPMFLSAQTLTPKKHPKKDTYGFWGAKKNGKYGFVIPPKYESVKEFRGDYAFVCHKGLWGIIGKDGKFVVEPKYDGVGAQKNNYTIVKLGNKYGVLQGIQVSVDFEYDELKYLGNDYAYARVGAKWGLVELDNGRQAISVRYDKINVYEERYLKARIGDKYELFSCSGYKITTTPYDDISLFEGKFLKVKQGDKYGLLDLSGKQLAAVQYDDISLYENKFLKVRQGGKYGLLNMTGGSVVAVQYNEISLYEKKFLKVRQGSKCGILDLSGKQIVAVQYDYISSVSRFVRRNTPNKPPRHSFGALPRNAPPHPYFKVYQGEKYGLFDLTGKMLLAVEYDDISLFDGDKILIITKGEESGLANSSGKIFAPLGKYADIKKVVDKQYLLMADTPMLVDVEGNINSNIIVYTTSFEGESGCRTVLPTSADAFDAAIISNFNTYGVGVIVFDKPITQIGYNAFSDCCNLTSITIPNSVTTIGSYAFEDCKSLKSITIPNSVTEIDSHAFKDCTSLTNITIPNSVTEIGWDVFLGCTSLPVIEGIRYADSYLVAVVDKTQSSYSIKAGTRFIGKGAFKDCTSLTRITIPDGITDIGSDAFYGCKSLKSVTIPNSVTDIGLSAFENCTSLESVYCKALIPPYLETGREGNNESFVNNVYGRKIYVPRQSVTAYKESDVWVEYYADDIVGYDFPAPKSKPQPKPQAAQQFL